MVCHIFGFKHNDIAHCMQLKFSLKKKNKEGQNEFQTY